MHKWGWCPQGHGPWGGGVRATSEHPSRRVDDSGAVQFQMPPGGWKARRRRRRSPIPNATRGMEGPPPPSPPPPPPLSLPLSLSKWWNAGAMGGDGGAREPLQPSATWRHPKWWNAGAMGGDGGGDGGASLSLSLPPNGGMRVQWAGMAARASPSNRAPRGDTTCQGNARATREQVLAYHHNSSLAASSFFSSFFSASFFSSSSFLAPRPAWWCACTQ